MQKALEQMNIKLNNVIRDITGKTGRAIIESILRGERDPEKLAQYRDYRIRASKQTLIKSLEGNWRQEQIFNLQLTYEHYQFLESQLMHCDRESEKVIARMNQEELPKKQTKAAARSHRQPHFDVQAYLIEVLGVDVTQIYGIKGAIALTVFSETGPNLKEKFPTEKQFLSWLNVVPDNKITGGKVVSSKVKKKKNNAGQAFRDAANALWNAQNPIGDYLRRKKAKSGSRKAIVATARKLASIYYKMVTEQVAFNPDHLIAKTNDYLQNKLAYLEKMAEKLRTQIAEDQVVSETVI
jgi:CRISPR/Cas system-associated endoribonuclease Cas2